MFKIAFMRAYYADDPYQASLPPLGIGYLMSYALQFLGGQIDMHFCRTIEDVLDYKPDLLALSSASENIMDARKNAKTIKDELGIPIIGGGMHLTAIPKALPPEYDCGAYGEGEITFKELVELYMANKNPSPSDFAKIDGVIYRDNGIVMLSNRRKEIKNLDELPYPARDLMGNQWLKPYSQQVHMISSRGCPYDCSFCSSGKHWKGVRYFSEEYTAIEIEYLKEKYNTREIYFFDDLMIANKKRFKRLCHKFEERGTHEGLVFRTYARVDLVDDELAEYFERFNFKYIDFGFESNNENVLKYFNKRLVTPDINQRAIDILRNRRLSVGANIIIGSPPETKEMALQSFDFIDRNKDVIERFNCALLVPTPGTGVWYDAVKKGVAREDMDWSKLNFNSVQDDKKNCDNYPMMAENMTRDELFEVYWKFKDLMKRVNTEGEKRYWIDAYVDNVQRLRTANSQIETLKGSRLVQAAMWMRDIKSKLFGCRQHRRQWQ